MGKSRGKGAASKDGLIEVDPALVRFTHSKIRAVFSCGRQIEQTMEQIRSGALQCDDLPTISVMMLEDGESFCSLNNRRLYVFKWAKENGFLESGVIKARYKREEKATRHTAKYSTERCSLTAKLMEPPRIKEKMDPKETSSETKKEEDE
eukprot:m.333291 g.333291  ORF g.333291 m.333291 type:complete len:150 (+) comp17110_c0_seq1:127-576(+)